VHVPLLDAPSAAAQTSHAPLHAVLQQTPSTQLADAHSLPAEQVDPFANFETHALLALQ
jgi:hypothetical protein